MAAKRAMYILTIVDREDCRVECRAIDGIALLVRNPLVYKTTQWIESQRDIRP